jgi:hypothetical protein
MTMRTITDRSGIEWEVFEVFPGTEGRGTGRIPVTFRDGWLCFQSPFERRRMVPIPLGWQLWDERTLRSALMQCHGTRRRTPKDSETQPREPRAGGGH